MRLRRHHGSRGKTGIMLIECLVYASIVMLLMGLALACFYEGWQNHRNLVRVTDDILQTLRAGEQWREDIRRSIETPRLETNAQGERLMLTHTNGLVAYVFRTNDVWRRAARHPNWIPVLGHVQASRMTAETHEHATAWRWDIALETPRQEVPVRPLFTFKAVPAP